jgi:hypothetical protein
MFNDGNENGLVIVQVGTPESDEEPVSWFKVLFSSGNTYLFSLKHYADFCLKSANACKEADLSELAELVDEKKRQDVSADDSNDNSQLDEAEDKETAKYVDDNSKSDTVVMPIDMSEKDIISKASSIFKDFAAASSIDGFNAAELPAQYISTFTAEFMTPRKTNGSLATKELNTNAKAAAEVIYGKQPFAFYYAGYANNIDKEQWQQAFCPIAWSGVKCTSMPKTVEDLSRQNTVLSNLD